MGVRRFVFPHDGDDIAAVAARELPGLDTGVDQLLSWNLHLATRLATSRSTGMLPSDIVFVEPPPPR